MVIKARVYLFEKDACSPKHENFLNSENALVQNKLLV